MTTIDTAQHVLANGCCLMRERKDEPHEWDVKPALTGNKRGWFYMDLQTANMLVTVYAALSPEHRAKFNRIPLMKLINFGWSQVGIGASA